MKVDAYYAEVNKDFELAEQWWIRVSAASPGDMDAINGIKRIVVSRRENEVSSQDNSVSASVEKRSESPLSSKSTPVTNTTRTEADIPLKSNRGLDYTNLRDLLAARRWKEADRETLRLILKAAGREKEGLLDTKSIEKFPCEELSTIDKLWVKYSNGHFGFSVNKRIYQSLGGTTQYNTEIWEKFGDTVGWRKNGKWLYYDDLTFSEKNTAPGHLPVSVLAGEGKSLEHWMLYSSSNLCWWFCWLE